MMRRIHANCKIATHSFLCKQLHCTSKIADFSEEARAGRTKNTAERNKNMLKRAKTANENFEGAWKSFERYWKFSDIIHEEMERGRRKIRN